MFVVNLPKRTTMNKRIALVGYGYWGPNLLRNLLETPGCEVVYCCDQDKEKLKVLLDRYPHLAFTADTIRVIRDPVIDAIVLATPTRTHFPLAEMALNAGKDVLIEKPMTETAEQAKKLVELAKKNKRIIMVDHTFLFNDAVVKIKKILDSGTMGNMLYIDAVRVNLGLFQKDTNVIYDLASHDFSIIGYLLGQDPKSIYTNSQTHFGNHENVAYIYTEYPNNVSVHVHVSWLSPVKIRRMLIVGTKKMIVYDDIEPTEKIRIYDKGVVAEELPKREEEEIRIGYRTGDVLLPKVDVIEPLSVLTKKFVHALHSREIDKSSGEFGAKIVEILENATLSTRTGKKMEFKNANRFGSKNRK